MTSAACSAKARRHCEGYDGKTVEFLYDFGGRLLVLTGKFVAEKVAQRERVAISYNGRLHPHDPPWNEYQFRLSAAHLRTVVPASRQGSQADFVMEQPLLPGDCLKLVSTFVLIPKLR